MHGADKGAVRRVVLTRLRSKGFAKEGTLWKRSRDRGVLAQWHNWKKRRLVLDGGSLQYFLPGADAKKGFVALDAHSKVRAGVSPGQQVAMAGVLSMKKSFSRLGSVWVDRSVTLVGNTLALTDVGASKPLASCAVREVEILDSDRGASKKVNRFDVLNADGTRMCFSAATAADMSAWLNALRHCASPDAAHGSQKRNPTEHCFAVDAANGEVLWLCADSKEDMAAWAEAIKQCISQLAGSTAPDNDNDTLLSSASPHVLGHITVAAFETDGLPGVVGVAALRDSELELLVDFEEHGSLVNSLVLTLRADAAPASNTFFVTSSHATVRLHVVKKGEHDRRQALGSSLAFSTFALQERDVELLAHQYCKTAPSLFRMARPDPRDGSQTPAGSEWRTLYVAESSAGPRARSRTNSVLLQSLGSQSSELRRVGAIRVALHFHESLARCIDSAPLLLNNEPPENDAQFSLAVVRSHIERIENLVAGVEELRSAWQDLLAWQTPVQSATTMAVLLLLCLRFNAEYWPLLLLAIPCVWLIITLRRRALGHFQEGWVEMRHYSATRRPIALLRAVVASCSDLVHPVGGVSCCHPFVVVELVQNHGTSDHEDVRLVAQTDTAHATFQPVWAPPACDRAATDKAQKLLGVGEHALPDTPASGGRALLATLGEKLAMSLRPRENLRLGRRALAKLVSRRKSDALSSVVEKWVHADGSVDYSAFRFPLLQEEEACSPHELIPWEDSRAELRFYCYSEEYSARHGFSDALLGVAKLPLREIVAEKEADLTLQMESPEALGITGAGYRYFGRCAHNGEPELCGAGGMVPTQARSRCSGTMQVRVGFDSAHSDLAEEEALRQILEAEDTSKRSAIASFWAKLKSTRHSALVAQQTLGSLADTWERWVHLFDWSHHRKTGFLLAAVLAMMLLCWLVPARFLMGAAVVNVFTKAWRRKGQHESGAAAPSLRRRLQTLLSTIPTTQDLVDVFQFRKEGFERDYQSALDKAKTNFNRNRKHY